MDRDRYGTKRIAGQRRSRAWRRIDCGFYATKKKELEQRKEHTGGQKKSVLHFSLSLNARMHVTAPNPAKNEYKYAPKALRISVRPTASYPESPPKKMVA